MVAEIRAQDRAQREEIFRLRAAARDASVPLQSEADLDPLLERIGEADIVLLGEASHGTSDFYTWRTRISQRLIREKGFDFLAVEGDWPDCARVNRYVKSGADGDPSRDSDLADEGRLRRGGESAYAVLNAFSRWPTWMWANREVVHLAEWLRWHNAQQPEDRRVGFYGLDVYSLWESMETVIGYLARNEPGAVEAARRAYACFEPYRRDEYRYAHAAGMAPESCADEVAGVLAELRRSAQPRGLDAESAFDAEQNALVAVNAEHYYRIMLRADAESWNIRDTHMADTLDRLAAFHRARRGTGKAIVWAHNTHIGDARATDMAGPPPFGMTSLGQLVRQRHEQNTAQRAVPPQNTAQRAVPPQHTAQRAVPPQHTAQRAVPPVLVGFSAYRGHVVAARGWGEEARVMRVPPAAPGSWDDVLHEDEEATGDHARLVLLDRVAREPAFQRPRGQRAIGVVYHSPHERPGNYVPTILPQRYNALVHFDSTRALHPLHAELSRPGEVPETFPTGV